MSAAAKWIWIQNEYCDRPEYVLFRKTVVLEEIPARLPLEVTADSRYLLSVNGHVIARGPVRSNTTVKYIDSVDIAPYLHVGENVLAIDAVHYAGDAFDSNEFCAGPTSIPSASRGGVLVDGDSRFCSDASWRCCRLDAYRFIPAENEYIGFSEQVDGRLYPFGWREVAYDDSRWEAAVERIANVVYTRGGLANIWQTKPRPIPLPYEREGQFVEITRTDIPQAIRLLDEGVEIAPDQTVYVELDAGVYKTGFVELEAVGGCGSRVQVTYAESYYQPHGQEYRKERRDDCSPGARLLGDSDVYIAGTGKQAYTSFHYRSFRFVRLEVTTGSEPLRLRVKSLRQTGYPLQVTTRFDCAEPAYNRIWDISLRTLQCCMYETYMDCPHYEQMQYLMDTMLEAIYTYSISGDGRLAEKAIRDFYEAQLPNGLIPCNAPARFTQIIPVFTLYWITMLRDHYRYFKNEELIREFFPGVEKIIEFFCAHLSESGLLQDTGFWQFFDWTEEWESGVPVRDASEANLLYSMVFVAALRQAEYLACVLERNDRAAQLRALSNRVAAAVEKYGYDAARGLYRDVPGRDAFSQHAQVWAVLSGIASAERGKAIMKKALKDKALAKCSFCAQYFLFRALEKTDLYPYSEKLWNGWKHLMDMQVTTWPEDPVTWRSDCHAWSSAPLYELVCCGLGVRPERGDVDAVHVEPKMLWLNSCRGTVRTRHGDVDVAWSREESEFSLHIRTSEPIDLVCVLPDGSEYRQRVDGELDMQCRCPVTYQSEVAV